MKKIVGMIISLCLVLAFIGCASAPPASEGMQNAKRNAPEGALVGMGTAKDAATAEKEARNSLIRAMTNITRSMIQDAGNAGEIGEEATAGLNQGVGLAISRSNLGAAVKLDSGTGKGNVSWVVMCMEKSDVTNEINTAVNAAKEITPNSEGFSIDSRLDAEYAKAIARDWSN